MRVIFYVSAEDSNTIYFPTCSDEEWASQEKLTKVLKRFWDAHKNHFRFVDSRYQ